MQALDLYASIEQYLDFEEETYALYNAIIQIVVSKEPKTLIDIGCGQGEFCRICSLNGIKTLGVDKSQKQIDIACLKDIDAKCIDIQDIKDKYDCATAVFDVINYLPKDYIKIFLIDTYNLLNEGGFFIFDINSLYGFNDIAQGTLNVDTQDKFIAIDASFEDEVLYTDITLFESQNSCYKKQTGTIEQYYYTNEELANILTSAGFKVEKIIDFNLHSTNEADKYIFICKKG